MRKWVWCALLPAALLAVLLTSGGCKKSQAPTNGPPPAVPPGPPGPGGETPSGLREIMGKIGRGPQSLDKTIGRELDADPTPWDAVQPQAKEYARLAAEMGKKDPPRGSKESWQKLTAAYAESAAALDRAAQAKDLAAAKTAHTELGGSCMSCHREHRQMGGPGGPGGGPPGGPPRGPKGSQ